ncbi:methyltransferase domain-containing protein [Colletotrichum chrysophilum]|uniref:Methyltransferase domain-containing protein n=1 Tax=Colletotrichum chrysophilum TaxID=1836956 RepID=A0AAD9EDX0_9PEZI|nr:methyltransferase domain-containing protein [Colletotrichum chrysophilum]
MTDTTTANKAYFNKLAAEYDTKYEKTILQLEREIRKRKDFIGVDWVDEDDDEDEDEGDENSGKPAAAETNPATDSRPVRLLDYACGTGLISRALAQFTTHCVGIDISENMVAAYNARAENQVSQSFLPLFAPLPFTHRRNPSRKYTRVSRTWLSFLFSQW